MAEEDKFCLKWNDFQDNIVRAHRNLRSDRDFHDVTLVCGGETFQAHRVILGACSPAFRDMIRQSSHHHPVLYLRGVRKSDIAALLDFMYHGEASLPEDDLEDFLATAEDLQVRGLVLPEGEEGNKDSERSRRVSGSNLATAVDDDVASLLAGLDNVETGHTGQPPPKKVKQEKHEAGRQLASLSSLSVSSSSTSVSRDELAARIKIKQEAREQQQEESQTHSVEAARNRLASLTSSISLGRTGEASPGIPAPSYPQQPNPSSSYQQQPTALPTRTTPHQTPQQTVQTTMTPHSVSPSSLQTAPQAYNITSLTQSAILRHIQQSGAAQSLPQQQQVQPRLQQPQQLQHRLHTQPSPVAMQPQASAQLQQLVRVHAPPVTAVTGIQHPGLARVQVQMQGGGGPSSPPVLHIPEGYNNYSNTHQGTNFLNTTNSASPGPTTDTQEGFTVDEDPEYERQVEAYIERLQTGEGPKLRCRACQKIVHAKSKATMVNHVESTHIMATVTCNYCTKIFKARSYLKNHLKNGKCAGTAT